MKEYRNKTRETLHLLLGDKKIEVGPLDSTLLDASEAELADLKYGDVLERIDEEGRNEFLKETDPNAPIWLANMSGNPDAAETIELEPRKNKLTGLHERRFELNVLAKPRDYVIWRRPKPIRQNIDGFTHDIKQAKKAYSINYMECKPVEPSLAKAFLKSAAGLGVGFRGWIIESRPQDFFKPDRGWSYDEIVMWLDFVNPGFNAKDFPTEQAIRKEARSGSHAERELFKAKDAMLKRVFFVCADPRFTVPTRSEWEKYYGRADVKNILGDEPEPEVKAAPEPAPVKKKRGRPRKKPQPSADAQ